MSQRVLITGIHGHVAGRLARRLEADGEVDAVVGVGLHEPSIDLARTDFVRADIRNPLVVKILQGTEVDTVVHLGLLTAPGAAGRAQMKETNVIGALQLFAACQRAEGVRKVVVKSSAAVYGASPRDPALFTEEMSARSEPRGGFARDVSDVEQYARDFGRRRPDVVLTILRFANLIGPVVESTMTRYLSLPVIPTALGYDPRLQFLHEDDAVESLYRAVREDHPGIFNVAGDGAVPLSQAVRLMGKLPVPVVLPLAAPLAAVLRRLGLVDFPADQLSLLLYGRMSDTARLKRELGWSPRFGTKEALLDFVRGRGVRGVVTAEELSAWEREAYAFLDRMRGRRPERARGGAT